MRLVDLTLKNYIGIYNGLGLYEIWIPFYKCKSNFVIIKGDNGSGKSTLFRALSPFVDSVEDIIYNKDGYKQIQYQLNDRSLLTVTYTMTARQDSNGVWRHNSKCSITRTFLNEKPIELNPSGNISSGKEIIYHIFQLDDNFVVLSELSATNKGIGSQIPSERKKYVNSIVNALDGFIALHATFNKKTAVVKSLLNNLSSKLSQIGDINAIQASLQNDQTTLKQFEDTKNALISAIARFKTQLDEINKNGNIVDTYASSTRKLMKLQKTNRSSFFTYPDTTYNEEELIAVTKDLVKQETLIEMHQDRIKTLLNTESQLTLQITELDHKIGHTIDDSLPKTEEKLAEIDTKIEHYKNLFKESKIPKALFLDKATYKRIVESINRANAMLDDLYQQFYINDICKAIEDGKDLSKQLEHYTGKYKELSKLEFEYIIQRDQDDKFRQRQAAYNKIPQGCQFKETCIYVKNIVSEIKQILSQSDREYLDAQIRATHNAVQDIETKIENLRTLQSCYKDIQIAIPYLEQLNYDIVQFTGTQYFESEYDIKSFLMKAGKIDFNMDILNTYFGYLDLVNNLIRDKTTLEEKKQQLLMQQKNNTFISLRDQLKVQLEDLKKEKDSLKNEIKSISSTKTSLESTLHRLQVSKEEEVKYQEFLKEVKETSHMVEELQEKANQAIKFTTRYTEDQRKLSELVSTDIPMLTSRIEQYKYQLTIYGQYKQEYDTYSSIYEKLTLLRDKSSIHGIQAVYIEAFMNSILQLTNQLLQMLFQGRFMIKEFRVNEKEFSIPCIDSEGQERPDISCMSDSQLSLISMIISFVLLHKATGYYKIIKLDEVDANLDNTNRLQFVKLIRKMIDVLNFDQCIIISHNNEIYVDSIDMIVLKINNAAEYQNLKGSGANIIYSYEEQEQLN